MADALGNLTRILRGLGPAQGPPRQGFTGHGNGVGTGYRHEGQALVAVAIGLCAGAGYAAAVDVGDLAGGGIVGQDERGAARTELRDDGYALYGGDGKGRCPTPRRRPEPRAAASGESENSVPF